jgi:hypothetical protein
MSLRTSGYNTANWHNSRKFKRFMWVIHFKLNYKLKLVPICSGPPLWSSGQSFWLVTDPEVSGSISDPTKFSEK